MISFEQQARNILERCGWEDAQTCTACDVVELANLLQDIEVYKIACKENGIDLSRRIIGRPTEKNNEAMRLSDG